MTISKQTGGKLIQCVLPKGKGLPLMEALAKMNITRFGFSYARGFDIHDVPGRSGIPEQVEKEMVFVVASDQSEADRLFTQIYELAGVNTLGGGFIYMSTLSMATLFALPELAANEVNPVGDRKIEVSL